MAQEKCSWPESASKRQVATSDFHRLGAGGFGPVVSKFVWGSFSRRSLPVPTSHILSLEFFMQRKFNQDEAADAASNDDPQVDYEKRAKRYLKAIGRTPSLPVSKEAGELHSRLKTAVEYLRERQRDYRTMCCSDVLPSYEMLGDTLVNLVCDMWGHIEHASTEPDARPE